MESNTYAGVRASAAKRQSVGETVGMILPKVLKILGAGLAALSILPLVGCGGGSTANVITVTVTATNTSLIVGQSATLTATVSGATNTNVNWPPQFLTSKAPCQYTTTTTDSTGKQTVSALTDCPTDGSLGTLTNLQATGTATYTAPSTLPDPNKFPLLRIIITAQSVQNTNKTGKITLAIISGINVTLNLTSASVPTGEPQQFSVQLTNDLKSQGVTWAITQQLANSQTTTNNSTPPPNPYFGLATCSPTCGTITPDANTPTVAVYTAPTTLPTAITPPEKNNTNPATQVTLVATAVADNASIAVATITIVQGGPITFNGITPTIAPQGATFWDIYLDAPFISSASTITLTDSHGGFVQKLSNSGQVKVLFALPVTTTTNGTTTTTTGPPTGARLRLNANDLVAAGPFTISVSDPAQPCNGLAVGTPCTAKGTGTYNIIPVRPTSIATTPDDVVQGQVTQSTNVIVDGGYFGPSGNLAEVFFQGNAIGQNASSSSASHLVVPITAPTLNSSNPGLYPLSVESRANPLPSPNNPSVTNIAIFPNYSATPPAVVSGASGIPAGMNPSAVDLDPTLAVLVVVETSSNAIQFYRIGPGSLTPIDSTGTACATGCPVAVGTTPTGLSVNRSNHTVAVVNYGSQAATTTNNVCQITSITGQSVTVMSIPGSSPPITPFTVNLPFNSNLGNPAFQNSVCPAPMPYSIGVDPDTNLALVAYSSTSSSSTSNLGFIVNLNANTQGSSGNLLNPCALGQAINPSSNLYGQCIYSQVTLNTGQYPQVAVSPHGHMALVTPGGSGFVRGVDVTQPASGNVLKSLTLTANLVTATVDTTQCPPGVPATGISPDICPLTMVPGAVGTVLISGVPKGANGTNFNGTFTVSVISNNSFSYALQSTVGDSAGEPSGACTSGSTAPCPTVSYGTPDQIYSISPTLQGVAINPITNTAAMADANSTSSGQIELLNGLDQTVSSISFSAKCTAQIPACPSSTEQTPTAHVAWQPHTNAVVSYNPSLNQVSISDPVSRQRYAFACAIASACQVNPIIQSQITLGGTGMATLTVQNGTNSSLTLFGGLAVDPVTNQAFVVKSGSGGIDVIDLGGPGTTTPIKPLHLSEVLVPSPTPGLGNIGGLPGGLVPQATLTCTTPTPPATSCDLPGVQIFGSGFDSTTLVRLDGTSIPPANVLLNSPRQLTVTIPASFVSAPHHFSLDALNSTGVSSNSLDFIVIGAVNMAGLCTDSTGKVLKTNPTSVAIADQLANGTFSPIAVITNQGCNSISAIDINPAHSTFGQFIGGSRSFSIVGTGPEGIAISERRGLAVIANNGSSTASVIDLTPLSLNPPAAPVQKVPDVTVGTNPVGVAISDPTGVAITANNGNNTITAINFGILYPPAGTAPPTSIPSANIISIGGIQSPLAVAVDPDRGTNNQGVAVVTSVQLNSSTGATGALSVVEIGFATPTLSTTSSSGFVSSTPTAIVFDPAVPAAPNPGVFFANSSGTNSITEFNPDGGGGSSVGVGINPTSLAVNPQTGALLTSNSGSNTVSIVDISSIPFKTRQTLGIPSSPTLSVAIDQFTNLAVIVDQANQRVLLFPMPN